MTSDENLRARLAAIDPIHRAGVLDPVPSPSRADIKDHITRVIDDPTDRAPRPAARRWRRPPILAAAAAIVAAAAIGVGALVDAAGNGSTPRENASTTVALTATPADAMASCLVFDVAVLSEMPLAFAGTATDVRADSVMLTVDRWYRGGSAERVTVSVPAGQRSVALDGVEFLEGQRYLVTATDGWVNGCGLSGPANPELENAFVAAFER
jgi:hypothetical protein